MSRRPRVVIVGAGFGGFQAAQSLAQAPAEILLINRSNYHTFIPLLYQVAMAQLEPEHIAYPLRTTWRTATTRPQTGPAGVQFLMAEVQRIDCLNRWVEAEGAVIPYDYLVLATGSRTQFLGVPGASDYAFSLRTLDQAIALRNHILTCFEQAMREPDLRRRQTLLTFVIVGGGPTGVEVAGALRELAQGSLARDYPSLEMGQVRLVLVQSGDRLLADLPPRLSHYTYRRLRRMGVKIHLQTRVRQVEPTQVQLQNGLVIPAATIIWTAGLEAAHLAGSESLTQTIKGKLAVRPTLQLQAYTDVYAVGDLAYVQQQGKPLTGVAPEALQQGAAVAGNIKRQLRGQDPQPFHYFNKGRLAIIGGFSGVGKIGPFAFTGGLAWVLWLAVHLVYLPGLRNRLIVLLSWLHAYLMGDRAVRLILPMKSTKSPPIFNLDAWNDAQNLTSKRDL